MLLIDLLLSTLFLFCGPYMAAWFDLHFDGVEECENIYKVGFSVRAYWVLTLI